MAESSNPVAGALAQQYGHLQYRKLNSKSYLLGLSGSRGGRTQANSVQATVDPRKDRKIYLMSDGPSYGQGLPNYPRTLPQVLGHNGARLEEPASLPPLRTFAVFLCVASLLL